MSLALGAWSFNHWPQGKSLRREIFKENICLENENQNQNIKVSNLLILMENYSFVFHIANFRPPIQIYKIIKSYIKHWYLSWRYCKSIMGNFLEINGKGWRSQKLENISSTVVFFVTASIPSTVVVLFETQIVV